MTVILHAIQQIYQQMHYVAYQTLVVSKSVSCDKSAEIFYSVRILREISDQNASLLFNSTYQKVGWVRIQKAERQAPCTQCMHACVRYVFPTRTQISARILLEFCQNSRKVQLLYTDFFQTSLQTSSRYLSSRRVMHLFSTILRSMPSSYFPVTTLLLPFHLDPSTSQMVICVVAITSSIMQYDFSDSIKLHL